ncbi:DNA ligase D [Falsirhodobacter algicola]|uniref:DNA ligase (ATP) n=1 Tax=Falsirhodobacter algicola TaxID=2692330 RepID=A0A8J8SKK0_9RHOB|nr:DNA ligase D [Falsirhodobacter algicola]QUS35487.1 DNA ligase D [Falsirhodobacter algicola]
MDPLDTYRRMRDFAATPEPSGTGGVSAGPALRYGVQMHDATRLHWDLRLEWRGALLSWAVTRGPSLDPADKRLAVRTEDHPLDYLTFEGTIPKGQYGAGTVMLWDIGWWQPYHDVADGLAKGHLHFALHGRRAGGGYSLIRMKGKRQGDAKRENWLLIKEDDAAADPEAKHFAAPDARSVATNRTLEQIGNNAPALPFGPRRRHAMPAFHEPQLATAVDTPPTGAEWLHEVKLDGYRALIGLGKDGVRIFTRSGLDWSDRFAELLPPLADLPCDAALIDAEIVAGAGLQGFSALQAAIKAGGPFQVYAFDLLSLNGASLTGQPLTKRRAALERLLAKAPPRGPVRPSPVLGGAAQDALAAICAAGGEGLVSKLAQAPYRSGRGTSWQKTKCIRRAEFLICGWMPSDKRGRTFASLLLATAEGGGLVYRGKVGTGFDTVAQEDIMARLAPLARKSPPLSAPRAEVRGAKWVDPQLAAEILHAELTSDGRLRHARFVALREDKAPEDIALDPPVEVQMDHGTRPRIAGIGISHPDRLLFPKPRITKQALAEYHEAMADRLLPTLKDRPAALLRLPEGLDGERFFQKHPGKGFPDAIRSVRVPQADGSAADHMCITDTAGLVAAVQMGTVEFHPWGARRDRLDRPERLVFDLDPDEALGFARVREAALHVRDRLADLGLPSWAMVTGGKGVHVIVPLRRTASWQTAKIFAQLFATLLAEDAPGAYTASMSKAQRKGRIFVDWLRNERGATAVAPFSVRARPGAPVAVPVAWDELRRLRRANGFSMKAAQTRSWADLDVPEPAGLNKDVLARLERK